MFVPTRKEIMNEAKLSYKLFNVYTCSKSMPWQAEKERGSVGEREKRYARGNCVESREW